MYYVRMNYLWGLVWHTKMTCVDTKSLFKL